MAEHTDKWMSQPFTFSGWGQMHCEEALPAFLTCNDSPKLNTTLLSLADSKKQTMYCFIRALDKLHVEMLV